MEWRDRRQYILHNNVILLWWELWDSQFAVDELLWGIENNVQTSQKGDTVFSAVKLELLSHKPHWQGRTISGKISKTKMYVTTLPYKNQCYYIWHPPTTVQQNNTKYHFHIHAPSPKISFPIFLLHLPPSHTISNEKDVAETTSEVGGAPFAITWLHERVGERERKSKNRKFRAKHAVELGVCEIRHRWHDKINISPTASSTNITMKTWRGGESWHTCAYWRARLEL